MTKKALRYAGQSRFYSICVSHDCVTSECFESKGSHPDRCDKQSERIEFDTPYPMLRMDLKVVSLARSDGCHMHECAGSGCLGPNGPTRETRAPCKLERQVQIPCLAGEVLLLVCRRWQSREPALSWTTWVDGHLLFPNGSREQVRFQLGNSTATSGGSQP